MRIFNFSKYIDNLQLWNILIDEWSLFYICGFFAIVFKQHNFTGESIINDFMQVFYTKADRCSFIS